MDSGESLSRGCRWPRPVSHTCGMRRMFPQRRMQGELALTRIKNRPQMSARIVGIRQIGRHRPAVAIALFWLSGSRSEERGHSIVHRFRGRRHMHGIANVDLMVAVAGQVGRPWQARGHAGREPLAVVVMEPVCNLGQFYFLPTWSMVGAGFFLVTASTEIPNQLFEEGKVTIQGCPQSAWQGCGRKCF